MSELLTSIYANDGNTWGLILVIGAGSGGDLPQIRKNNYRRAVLVEAYSELAKELGAKVVASAGEEYWELAVTPLAQDTAAFFLLNEMAYNSLSQPTTLYRFLPSVRAIETMEVKSLSLSETVLRAGPWLSQPNLLVIDTPGQSGQLVQSISLEMIQLFERVVVYSGVEALYENEKDVSAVISYMLGAGFNLSRLHCKEIHPFAALVFQRNEKDAKNLDVRCADEHTFNAEIKSIETIKKGGSIETRVLKDLLSTIDQYVESIEVVKQELEGLNLAQASSSEASLVALQKIEQLENELSSSRVTSIDRKNNLNLARNEIISRDAQIKRLETEVTLGEERRERSEEHLLKLEAQLELLKELLLTGSEL